MMQAGALRGSFTDVDGRDCHDSVSGSVAGHGGADSEVHLVTAAIRITGVLSVVASVWACAGDSRSVGDEKGRGGAAGADGGSAGSGASGGASGAMGGSVSGGESGSGVGGSAGGIATGGASGMAGSGATGPCQGLACDQTTCTRGDCTQMPCATGESTTVSGTVRDPAAIVPLYNVIVYVPDGPVPPFTPGASCSRCAQSDLRSVTATLTGPDGRFVLPDVPVGLDIPIVIQIGKWRRQLTVQNVPRCVDTPLTDAEQTSLPSKRSEGDMPLIAITTGGADSMECLPLRMGIEASEFTTETGDGRIHLYAGTDSGTSVATTQLDSGTALTHSDTLWSNVDALRRYDIVILSCEGDSAENPRPNGARQAVSDYTALGGRLLASHWHHRWISSGPAPMPDVATFADRDNPDTPVIATVNTSFPKGQALAEWLVNVNASIMLGQVQVLEARDNVQAVNTMYATEWLSAINANELDTPAVQYFSFNTPLTVEESMQCGRVVFSNLHVSNASDMGTPGDNPGSAFPGHCAVRDLTPQERAVEFMLFDISACLQDDDLPPTPPGRR